LTPADREGWGWVINDQTLQIRGQRQRLFGRLLARDGALRVTLLSRAGRCLPNRLHRQRLRPRIGQAVCGPERSRIAGNPYLTLQQATQLRAGVVHVAASADLCKHLDLCKN
jgi:hypothetical protein